MINNYTWELDSDLIKLHKTDFLVLPPKTSLLQTFTDADNYVINFPVGISMYHKVDHHYKSYSHLS